MDSNNLPPRGQSVGFYLSNLEPESKPEIEGIHLHHKDMSN